MTKLEKFHHLTSIIAEVVWILGALAIGAAAVGVLASLKGVAG